MSEREHEVEQTMDDVEQAVKDAGPWAETAANRASEMSRTAMEQAGHKIDKVSDYLHRDEVKRPVEGIKGFAREHPLRAVAGGVLLGFVVGRIFK